jgi:hypothetical protein
LLAKIARNFIRLQQRQPPVLGLGQHPRVELQPGQLAAGEALVRQVRRRRQVVAVEVGGQRAVGVVRLEIGQRARGLRFPGDVVGGHAAMIAQPE